MGKYKSMMAERMLPSYIPDPEMHRDAYPGVRRIVLARDPVDIRAVYPLGDGYFFPETYVNDFDEDSPFFYMWLPDSNGVCKITEDPAPFNKLMGYVDLEHINPDIDIFPQLFLVGLHKAFKVALDWKAWTP